MINTLIEEIKKILTEYGGKIELNSRLVCKMSPHSHPVILYSIDINDLDNYSIPVLQTILQRLKLIKHSDNK